MGVKGEKEASGHYVIRMSGVFTNQERKAMEAAGRAVIDRNSKIRILILADGFAGWGKEGDWGDIRFKLEYDPCMEKIAVVAEEKLAGSVPHVPGGGPQKGGCGIHSVGPGEPGPQMAGARLKG